MSKKQISPLVIVGGAAALYFLFGNSGSSTPGTTSVNPITNALAQLLPGSTTTTQQIPTTYGINSGIRGGDGSYFTCANYAQLLAVNPNLGNPNYVMTDTENGQYLANYLNLQQALPYWVGQKAIDGTHPANILQAAQVHWRNYGCAAKMIFLPLEPPSGANYVPPPSAKKSSGSGILGTILKSVTIVAGAALTVASAGTAAPLIAAGTSVALTAESAIHGVSDTLLNDSEVQLLFQGAAIIYDILPLYAQNDPLLVAAIKLQLDTLLKQYA
jgi:hypothetical protein